MKYIIFALMLWFLWSGICVPLLAVAMIIGSVFMSYWVAEGTMKLLGKIFRICKHEYTLHRTEHWFDENLVRYTLQCIKCGKKKYVTKRVNVDEENL